METATLKTIDLASLDTTEACNKGAEIELLHPTTGEGLGQFVTILGSDSTEFQEYIARVGNEARRKQFQAQRRNRTPEIETVEVSKAEGIALLVAMTKGWRNIFFEGNPNFAFSSANATALYTRFPFICRQIDKAIVDLENFIPG